jgi:hypothetical protein
MNDAAHNELGLTLQRFVDWAHEQGWRYQMAPVHLHHLQGFLQRHGVEPLSEVNAALLGEYQHWLLVHRSSTTVKGYVATLRALWRCIARKSYPISNRQTERPSRRQRAQHAAGAGRPSTQPALCCATVDSESPRPVG